MNYSSMYLTATAAASNVRLASAVKAVIDACKTAPLNATATTANGSSRNKTKARVLFAILSLEGVTLPKSLSADSRSEIGTIAKSLDKRSLRSLMVSKPDANGNCYVAHTKMFKTVNVDTVPADAAGLVEAVGPDVSFDVTESTGQALAPLLTAKDNIVFVQGDVAYVAINNLTTKLGGSRTAPRTSGRKAPAPKAEANPVMMVNGKPVGKAPTSGRSARAAAPQSKEEVLAKLAADRKAKQPQDPASVAARQLLAVYPAFLKMMQGGETIKLKPSEIFALNVKKSNVDDLLAAAVVFVLDPDEHRQLSQFLKDEATRDTLDKLVKTLRMKRPGDVLVFQRERTGYTVSGMDSPANPTAAMDKLLTDIIGGADVKLSAKRIAEATVKDETVLAAAALLAISLELDYGVKWLPEPDNKAAYNVVEDLRANYSNRKIDKLKFKQVGKEEKAVYTIYA